MALSSVSVVSSSLLLKRWKPRAIFETMMSQGQDLYIPASSSRGSIMFDSDFVVPQPSPASKKGSKSSTGSK